VEPTLPSPTRPLSPREAAAADKSAAEAAAVIAEIERIVGGEAESPESGQTVEEPAMVEAAPLGEAPPPATEAPAIAETVAEAPAAAAATEAAHITIEMPAIAPTAEPPGDEAEEETAAPARPELRTTRRRPIKRTAEVDATGGEGKAPVEARGGYPPMFVIAVASQKGGAGKTTLAAHLAVRAGIAGQGPVVLIDTDPQGSLAEWWQARSDETPALAVVKPEQLGANLAELRSYGTAVAVIDTPPALTGSIEQVIAMSDLIIIPVRPSPHDLRAAGGTVEMAHRAGKPFIFVVNGASPRASITAQAVAALSEHGRVAPVILYQRTEYAASMIDGRTVVEAAPSGRSAQEIAELWQCIFAQVGMRAAA
jgi:chromosome partitioning protein